jgi:hypothetical protein
MSRRKRATRVPVAHTRSGGCDCVVCREREQLHDVAQRADSLPIRIVAMTLLGAMDAAHEGCLGAFTIEDCFD